MSDEVPWLGFEANERQRNLANLAAVEEEIAQRSGRLRTRILHFAEQFGIPEVDLWRDLDANPNGPLAATLAKEARRQNIHETAAAIRTPFIGFRDSSSKISPGVIGLSICLTLTLSPRQAPPRAHPQGASPPSPLSAALKCLRGSPLPARRLRSSPPTA